MNRFAWLLAAILTVVAAWSGGWFYFAGQIRAGIEASAMNDGVAAPRLVCDDLAVTGFPFRFDAACTSAGIVSGDLNATVPEIRASALAYRPNHIRIWALGPATVVDSFTGARNVVRWEGMEASLRLESGRIERLSVTGDDLDWVDTLVGEALIASTPHAEFHLIDIPEQFDPASGRQALAGYATAEAVAAPQFDVVAADLALETEISALPIDTAAYSDPAWLPAWQQAGGQLRIVSLSGSDGDNHLSGQGELSLNEAGQIDGQVRLNSRGVVERFASQIPGPLAGAIFGSPAEDGSYSQTINLRGGVIMAGLIPAGLIPPLF